MIDKINGNGVYYPDQNQNKKKNPAVQAYENTPGTKETALRKAGRASKTSHTGAAGSSESGVILDLSAKAARGKEHAKRQIKEKSWMDVLRELFAPVLHWIKVFWESDSPKKDAQGTQGQVLDVQEMDGQSQDTQEIEDESLQAGAQEELELEETVLPPVDAAIRDEAVKSGSIQKIEQYVTQNGTKHLAHNSDLLTYYDRRGKIVQMDETEKYRVLFGDKNVLKL